MKIKDLIKELKRYDQEMECMLQVPNEYYTYDSEIQGPLVLY